MATKVSSRRKGWGFDASANRLAAEFNGTEVFDFDADDMVITANLTTSGTHTNTGDLIVSNGSGAVIGNSTQLTVNALIPELQVQGSVVGVDGAALVALYSSTAGEGPEIILARSKSATLGTNTIVASGDSLGRIVAMGADGSTGFDPAAAIQFEVAGTPGASTDMPGRILFQTSPDGSQTPATCMTILSGATTVAKVQLGTAGTSTGSIDLSGATSGVVTITPNATAGTWTLELPAAVAAMAGYQLTDASANGVSSWGAAASKRELKNVIGQINDKANEVLDRVLGTNVYAFTYKEGMGTGDTETVYHGIMADESPEFMHFKGGIVNPVNTLGDLILAIQALNKKVDLALA